ncbi:MAG: hypothetical protein ABSH37_16505 [Bryobacteraceae bacterium]|jgi:hypothetical protein
MKPLRWVLAVGCCVADLNGKQDLVIAHYGGSTYTSFLFGNGEGTYLPSLRNAEFAASWAKAQASLPHGPGGSSLLGQILYGRWKAKGGGGDPRGTTVPRPSTSSSEEFRPDRE